MNLEGVDPTTAVGLVCAAVGTVLAITVALAVVRGLLFICRPNEALIFSGRKHRLPDGTEVGYRVVRRGWALRTPMLQTVSRMDMRLFMVEVSVANAYSKGGIPLTVAAIANVKLSSHPTLVRNAVERFLGMDPKQISQVARQTLEGVLREVLAQLTPEEVNEDRLKFAEHLRDNAKDDFDKLGLELDVLKVQHVSDEQKYLQNLGRARIALMIRDAQNAENEANQKIAEEEAAARQRAQSAQKKAEATVLQKQNQLRAELAKMEAQAKSVENEAQIAAETARAAAEQEMQRLRAELEKLRLQCDVVLPAEAARQAAEARARGDAAPLVENGKAAAEALALLAGQWQAAGPGGREVYLLQQLRSFVEAAVGRVAQTQVGELTIVDGGDGEAYAAFVANFPAAVARVMAETARAVGVDVRALLGATPTVEVTR
jgi:flotillin